MAPLWVKRFLKFKSDRARRTYIVTFTTVCLTIFFSKPIYDVVIVPIHCWYKGIEHPMTEEIAEFRRQKALEYEKKEEEARQRQEDERKKREKEIEAQRVGVITEKIKSLKIN